YRLVMKPSDVMTEATYKQVVKEIADKIGLPFDLASLTWSQLQGLPITTGDPEDYQRYVNRGLGYPVPKNGNTPNRQVVTTYTPRPRSQRSITMRVIDTLFNGFGDEGGRNVALTKFVGLLFNKWVDCDLETAYELVQIANSVTTKPLPIDEIDTTFRSILDKELRKRGIKP
ncbi:TPA: primase alpha helix C-terminal domain-containing protein, partial [Streptococcus pyogenes]